MKKQFTLILCCVAIVASGMAQPKTGKIRDYLQKMQNTATQTKSVDWWEPSEIYLNSMDGFNGRHTFSYKNGKCSVDLAHIWMNNQWINSEKVTYNYDSKNNMIELLIQLWSSEKWENDTKATYTYNPQNNVASVVLCFQKFDQWDTIQKRTYKYDPQNNNTEIMEYDWFMGDWIVDGKITMKYNSENKMTEELYQYWEDDNWVNEIKVTITYNLPNKSTEYFFQYWEDEQWWDVAKMIFSYDNKNNITEILYKYWEDDEWQEEERVLLTYDSRNNRITELWQYGGGYDFFEWEDDERYSYSYDENNNATSGFAQYWNGNTWVDSDSFLDIFYNNMKSNYFACCYINFTATYVDPYSVNIKENNLLNNEIKVYPNPVSDILHIEIENPDLIPDVKIFSIQGKLLIHTKSVTIDLSSLKNGIYIVNVNGVYSKIVKQ